MTMQAGQRRHRIKIQALVKTTDPEYGGQVESWTDVIEVRAKRTNTLKATTEAVASGTTIAPVQVRFDLRPRKVDASMRLVGVGGDHDGVIYDIKNVGISNDRSEMAIIATSGASNG